jgi:hypothetical protein
MTRYEGSVGLHRQFVTESIRYYDRQMNGILTRVIA